MAASSPLFLTPLGRALEAFMCPTTAPTRTAAATGFTGSLPGDLAATSSGPTFVVHSLAPRALGAPLHTHRDQDEWSYVISGLVGVRVGAVTVTARAGDVVLKPRGVPHAFWNAGTAPARFLEVLPAGGVDSVDVDLTSVPGLLQEHGLVLP